MTCVVMHLLHPLGAVDNQLHFGIQAQAGQLSFLILDLQQVLPQHLYNAAGNQVVVEALHLADAALTISQNHFFYPFVSI